MAFHAGTDGAGAFHEDVGVPQPRGAFAAGADGGTGGEGADAGVGATAPGTGGLALHADPQVVLPFPLDCGAGFHCETPNTELTPVSGVELLAAVGDTLSRTGPALLPLFHSSAVSAASNAFVSGYKSLWNELMASLRGTWKLNTSQTPPPFVLRFKMRATSQLEVSHDCFGSIAAAKVIFESTLWSSA